MKIVDFKEAYQRLTRQAVVFCVDREMLDFDALLNVFTKEYSEINIEGTDKENPDSDMLLFEYGIYDWTGNGKQFTLSLKRQVFLENIDECGSFGFTIYYDHQKAGPIKNYSKWCESRDILDQWRNEIFLTEGCQKIKNIAFERIHYSVERPH